MRFTIRDLLWLTVVVGLAVWWAVNYRSLAQHRLKLDQQQSLADAAVAEALAEADQWHEDANELATYLRQNGWQVELSYAGVVKVVSPQVQTSSPANTSPPASNLPRD